MSSDHTNPEIVFIATVAVALIVVRTVEWVRDAKTTPDPWDEETDHAVHDANATPLCHHCLVPHSEDAWFCEQCGSTVGPYNTLNPYLSIFSTGEVLRKGTAEPVKLNSLTYAGFLLLGVCEYAFFAPVYWLMFFQNARRRRDASSSTG
jgi:hypothetical protein